jgi:hypothetical protein
MGLESRIDLLTNPSAVKLPISKKLTIEVVVLRVY